MVGGVGGWFGCTSSHAENSCVPAHMQIARKFWDFVSLFCMVLQSENAFLTLPNGQETKKNPPRGGLFSFSDCFPFSVWLEIRWVYFVEIGIFVFVFTFSFSTHFANPRSSRRSGIPGRCLKSFSQVLHFSTRTSRARHGCAEVLSVKNPGYWIRKNKKFAPAPNI